ncbi:MAG: endolytic transglycosylase MltG [Candidatus Paceibacterota bacterium]
MIKYIFFSICLVSICILPKEVFAITIVDGFSKPEVSDNFIVAIDENDEKIVENLYKQKIIKNEVLFNLIIDIAKLHGKIKPGGYKVNASMNEIQIIRTLINEPYMKWVVIPEGLRKEEIAELISKELGWREKQKSEWIYKTTADNGDYIEGVYFPDTYLLPINETGKQISQRMINRFNEKFSDYSQKFINKNIKWTTALKVASIVQREAASKDDMAIIAGVIWNRLERSMKLEIDATIQYIRDSKQHSNTELCRVKDSIFWKNDLCFQSSVFNNPFLYISSGEWWGPIVSADKKLDSSYNSYLYSGLPLHPISNPGVDAIEATLNPIETDCLFYLHDSKKKIYCANTYEEHLENISNYLK